MSKLTDMLPGMYAEMHAAGAFKGDSWRRHYDGLLRFLGGPREVAAHVVVDFGCGPAGGLADPDAPARRMPKRVLPYDPYVKAYVSPPWKAQPTAFFSCDVFEHLPVEALRDLARQLCKARSVTRAYVVLATRAATKTMPNGVNAHLTVRPADWWHGFFDGAMGNHYRVDLATSDLAAGEAVFGLVRVALPAEGA